MITVRRVTLRATVCGWMLALSTIVASGDQSPQQLPVFRAGTVLVKVDVYPRVDGRIVEGLTKDDFQVFENGKLQPVDGFEFIRIEPNTPDAALRDPRSVDESHRQAADPRNRLFIVYIDTYHTGFFGGAYTREPLLTFLRRAIGPTDLFGVMTPDLPITRMTLSRRIETIEDEIDKVWPWSEAQQAGPAIVDPTLEKLKLCAMAKLIPGAAAAAHREDVFMTSLEQLLARLQSLRDERKNIIFFSEGWIPARAFPGVATATKGPSLPKVGVDPATGRIVARDPNAGDVDRSWCEREAARLLNIDFERRYRHLLTLATQSNVGFYPVDVAGLRADQSAGSRARLETLLTMASATDGVAVAYTNDLAGSVRKIADDFSSFYLLGYYSTNAKPDGAYRSIEVKVRQPGVKVTARPGYFAPTPEMLAAEAAGREKAAPAAPSTPSALDAALARLGRIRADASLYTSVTASSSGLYVVVEIASREIESSAWSGGGAVALTVTPKSVDASPVQILSRIEPGTRSVAIRIPIADTSAGWHVRARVTGSAGTLDDEITVAAPVDTVVGEPAVFRAGASPRSALTPVADMQFRRTERVHVEWPARTSPGERGARLLSRRGDPLPVQIAVTERPADDGLVLIADAALGALAQGDYVLELTAGAAGGKVQKLLAFRIVR